MRSANVGIFLQTLKKCVESYGFCFTGNCELRLAYLKTFGAVF
jgi:hypothetical protein